MTNKEYADKVDVFRDACARAKIPPTARQASKFRNHQGIAWQYRNGAKLNGNNNDANPLDGKDETL